MAYTKESIFSKIGELLVEINDDYTELSNKNIAESDEALLLLEAKAKYLGTHIQVLRKLGLTAETTTLAVKEEEFTPPVTQEGEMDSQPVYNEIQEVTQEKEEPRLEQEIEEAQAEPQKEQIASDDQAKALEPSLPEAEASTEEAVQAEKEDQSAEAVVNEVIEEEKEIVLEQSQPIPPAEEEKPARPLTLNEILQQQRKGAAMSVSSPAPSAGTDKEKIVDLKSSINLNDKLLFIKDLFNGYSLAYSEAIELLNRYVTFAEADAFLQTNYALKNNWADKPQTVEKLYAILRKKFTL